MPRVFAYVVLGGEVQGLVATQAQPVVPGILQQLGRYGRAVVRGQRTVGVVAVQAGQGLFGVGGV